MTISFPVRGAQGLTVGHTALNQYLRDNLNGLHWRGAHQTADLVKNANTTLSNCTGLTIPVASGDVWSIVAHSFFVSSATADAKWTVTAPGSSTGRFGILSSGIGIGNLSSSTFGTGLALAVPGTLEDNMVLSGRITAGGAGSIQIQAAQNTSTAIDTTFRTYSFILGFRITGPSNSPIPDFTSNQVLTAANLETFLRDGLNSLRIQSGYLRGIVEALNTETPQDLTGMRFRVRSGEEWVWLGNIAYDSTATANIALSATAPSGSTGRYGVVGHGSPSVRGSTAIFGEAVKMAVAANSQQSCSFNGTVIASKDGYVQLQGSQGTATPGVTTSFHPDSWFRAFRVAA